MALQSLLKGGGIMPGLFSVWRGLILKPGSAGVRCAITVSFWDVIPRSPSYQMP